MSERLMRDYWGTGRVEAFSDGVFAIAITLLVLEISVPESAFDDLWHGIAEQWPSYLAYATSFITIGWIWVAHHGIFRRLQYANRRVMLINLLLLMAVAFLPFPTKLMAEASTRRTPRGRPSSSTARHCSRPRSCSASSGARSCTTASSSCPRSTRRRSGESRLPRRLRSASTSQSSRSRSSLRGWRCSATWSSRSSGFCGRTATSRPRSLRRPATGPRNAGGTGAPGQSIQMSAWKRSMSSAPRTARAGST